jgi:hypothetical protein
MDFERTCLVRFASVPIGTHFGLGIRGLPESAQAAGLHGSLTWKRKKLFPPGGEVKGMVVIVSLSP